MKYQPSLSEISSYWGKFETSRIAKERVSTKEFKIAFREKTEPYRKEDTHRITDDILDGYINLYAFFNDKEEITDLKTYTIFKKIAFDNIYLSPEYRFINKTHKSLSESEEMMLDIDVLVKLYTAFDEFAHTEEVKEFQNKFQDYYKKVELFADKSLEVGESVFIKGYADRKFSYETGRIEIEKHKEQELYHQGGYDYEILEELELAFKAMSNCLIKFEKKELTLFELKKALGLDALHLANSISTETQTKQTVLDESEVQTDIKKFINQETQQAVLSIENTTQSEIKEFENQRTQVDFLDKIKAETFLSKSYKLIDIMTKYARELLRIDQLEPFLENIKTKHEFYAERIKTANSLEELKNSARLLDKEYEQIELIGQEFTEE